MAEINNSQLSPTPGSLHSAYGVALSHNKLSVGCGGLANRIARDRQGRWECTLCRSIHRPGYLKRVALGEQIRVTRNGKVLARIVPEGDPGSAARIRLEALRGTMVVGDIVNPIDDVKWSADDDHL